MAGASSPGSISTCPSARSTPPAPACSTRSSRPTAQERSSSRATSQSGLCPTPPSGSRSHDRLPRRRRCAGPQGPAGRAPHPRHRPGDAAVRRRRARRLPLRAPRGELRARGERDALDRPALHRAPRSRPRVRRRARRRNARRPHPRAGIDLGEDLVGSLVGLERAAAHALPDPVSVLLGVLHAPLLDACRSAQGAHLRRVRPLRRRADPPQLHGDSPRRGADSPGGVQTGRTRHGGLDVPDVLRLLRRDARARRRALPARAERQASGCEPSGAAGATRMSTGEKYLWAAYLVLFAAVLLYVVLIALKGGRLERELADLADIARERSEGARG